MPLKIHWSEVQSRVLCVETTKLFSAMFCVVRVAHTLDTTHVRSKHLTNGGTKVCYKCPPSPPFILANVKGLYPSGGQLHSLE
jgi:hypothetical protein